MAARERAPRGPLLHPPAPPRTEPGEPRRGAGARGGALPRTPVTPSDFDVRDFAGRLGSWLSSSGPEADVVLSCRLRLARNLAGFPFVSRLAPDRAVELCRELREKLVEARLGGDTCWIEMDEASLVLRLLLRERHLISRDLAPSEQARTPLPGRAVAFGRDETLSVMVVEEDHLRLQAMAAGFDLESAWQKVRDLDLFLESRLEYAYSDELGYLTGCPTNVGTGLRASVMLHLPALGMVRTELEKVFTAAQRTGLAVRGLYGEGSRAAGDFYQVSNQVTLGRTEAQLMEDLRALVPVIVDFERKVRGALLDSQRAALQDRVSRSYGMLRTARSMPTDGALSHLSNVRLGHHLGLYKDTPLDTLNQLGVQIQKGHVQALEAGAQTDDLLDTSRRDQLRAGYLRRRLAAS